MSKGQMIHPTDTTIGMNIQRLRKARKWTLEKMAAELQLLGSSITRDTLTKIEHGRNIKADDLVAVKIALSTSFEELFNGVGYPQSQQQNKK